MNMERTTIDRALTGFGRDFSTEVVAEKLWRILFFKVRDFFVTGDLFSPELGTFGIFQ